MGVPHGDLLLMTRALKRGFADIKSIRRAVERQDSRPITLVEALHLTATSAEALRADPWKPDAVQDHALLEAIRQMLLEGGQLTPIEWERFVASIADAGAHREHPPLTIPQEFDGYALQWELARRERGVLYRGRDASGREVVIKAFRPDVPVPGDLPRVAGHAYAVAAFDDGETLEQKRPPLRRAVDVIAKAARIVAARPHGALTPARIAVRRDDSVVVYGHEWARAVPPSSRAAAYQGPDSSDVHALGAILYEAIVGTPPVGETSPAARTRQADEALDRIVACALSGGYASPAPFAEDLARWLRGEPVATRKSVVSPASRPRRWVWAAAVVLPLAGLAVWLATRGRETPPAPSPSVREQPPAPVPSKPAAAPEPAKPATVGKPPPAKPAEPVRPLTLDDEVHLQEECAKALGQGDIERLIALSDEALARGSKRDWPLSNLASAFLARGELDKALEYVSRAMEIAPSSRDYLEMRAHAYAFRGQAAKSLADLEALHGRSAAALNKEILKLDRQAKADPADARTRILKGVFFLLKRNSDAAVADFTAAIELGQRRALAWRARAHAADRRDAAIADAKAYLAEFPSDFASEEVKALLRDLGATY